MEAQTQMKIPVFNGDDHEIWSIKMRTLLMARDLWDVVENGVSEEKPFQCTGDLAERQKDLRIKDMTALHMLQMSLTDSVFFCIASATSSKQAWELLKADFGDTKVIRGRKRMELDKEYALMERKKEESVHEFTERFRELVTRINFYAAYGNVPDFVRIQDILSKLPPMYHEAVIEARYLHGVNKEFTLTEVLHILREAERFKKREEASHNNETSQCYSNNKRGRR